MTIAPTVQRIRNAIALRLLIAARVPACAGFPAAATVIASPRHDPIAPRSFVPAPPLVSNDVARPRDGFVRRLWSGSNLRRGLIVGAFVAGVQLVGSPSPPTTAARASPVNDPTRPYFAIVLVSVNKEPLHEIAPGYVPDVFYADRRSCLAGTRASVQDMKVAGVHGRFLCMFPREPDDALALEPREDF